MNNISLSQFVRESNRIEGIMRDPTTDEIWAHQKFLALPEVKIDDLVDFVRAVVVPPFVKSPLRDKPGMDVIVGSHRPPQGGEVIVTALSELLLDIHHRVVDPYNAHCRYETIHPFMDGNGRSGRALWAWHMLKIKCDPFVLPFLHRWYYDSLSRSR